MFYISWRFALFTDWCKSNVHSFIYHVFLFWTPFTCLLWANFWHKKIMASIYQSSRLSGYPLQINLVCYCLTED